MFNSQVFVECHPEYICFQVFEKLTYRINFSLSSLSSRINIFQSQIVKRYMTSRTNMFYSQVVERHMSYRIYMFVKLLKD